MSGAASKNTWSFDQLCEKYETPIYRYIYRLVGDREQAADLTQVTFLKALGALPKMGPNLKVSAWLYRIATNTCYDCFRKGHKVAWQPW